MENDVFDTTITHYEQFGAVAISIGEQVFLYRRLKDAYDKNLVAVVNELNEVIGYLDLEVARSRVLPGLKEGVRFQCIIAGEPVDGQVPLQIHPVAQSEVQTILSRQGIRRDRRGGLSPLAGIFDASDDGGEEELDDESVADMDDEELEEEFLDDDSSDDDEDDE